MIVRFFSLLTNSNLFNKFYLCDTTSDIIYRLCIFHIWQAKRTPIIPNTKWSPIAYFSHVEMNVSKEPFCVVAHLIYVLFSNLMQSIFCFYALFTDNSWFILIYIQIWTMNWVFTSTQSIFDCFSLFLLRFLGDFLRFVDDLLRFVDDFCEIFMIFCEILMIFCKILMILL